MILRQTLPVLLTEHSWWMNSANKHVKKINYTCAAADDDWVDDGTLV
jgi:hypothetical protein